MIVATNPSRGVGQVLTRDQRRAAIQFRARQFRGVGRLGIGETEKALLTILAQGAGTFAGSFLGIKAGISPALKSLQESGAAAAGATIKPKPKPAISTNTLLIGGGIAAAATAAFVFLR